MQVESTETRNHQGGQSEDVPENVSGSVGHRGTDDPHLRTDRQGQFSDDPEPGHVL